MGGGRAFLGVAGALAVVAQGCVSYDMYDRKVKESEANRAGLMAADVAVGNAKKEAELARLRQAALEKELAAANQRLANTDTVVEAKYKSLKEQYERMLGELRNEQGTEWTINQETGGVVLEESVFFAPGKAELKSDRFTALDGLIAKLNSPDFATKAIEIAGHTDSDPIARSSWKDNYQLSAERARAVLMYFQKKGIGPERLFLSGYGPSRPRSEKKSENRRVELVLHERA